MLRLAKSLPVLVSLAILGQGGLGAAPEPTLRGVERILGAEKAERGKAVCAVLESGIVTEVFEVEATAVNYRPGSKYIPHPLCTAFWDLPNKAEAEAVCQEELTAQTKRRMEAALKKETFEEPVPECLNEGHQGAVTLTVTKMTFDTPAEAVTSLEGTVAQLEEGITFEVQGKERTKQVDFEWADGVDDRAAWAPSLNELSVAVDGVRFAVAVRGVGDDEQCQTKAIEAARRIATALADG